jgi:hypothetical protein
MYLKKVLGFYSASFESNWKVLIEKQKTRKRERFNEKTKWAAD